MYVILLALSITWASYAVDTVTGIDPVVEGLEADNALLVQELEHASVMKNHYQKISAYSEAEASIAKLETEMQLKYSASLEDLLDRERMAYMSINKENTTIIDEKNATIRHYESVVSGYEVRLYEAMIASQEDAIKYERLETMIYGTIRIVIIFLLGIVLCYTLYSIQKSYLNRKASPKKVKKADSIKVDKAVPLTVVKNDRPKKTNPKSDGEAKNIKPKKNTGTKGKKADQPTPAKKVDSSFVVFVRNSRRKRETKKFFKLEQAKAKVLTQQAGDIIETTSVQDTNKKLAQKGGALFNTIKAVMTTKVRPEPKMEEKETPKSNPVKVEAKGNNKTAPKGKSKVAPKGKGNGKNRPKKSK